MFDLEKRALEEFPKLGRDECVIGSVDIWRERAVRLAREAADARAEEIARKIDTLNVYSTVGRTTEELCARLARSFISKPAETVGDVSARIAYGQQTGRTDYRKPAPVLHPGETFDPPMREGEDHSMDAAGYALGWKDRIVVEPQTVHVIPTAEREASIRADEREKQRPLIDQLWEKVKATHARLDALEERRKREQVLEGALRHIAVGDSIDRMMDRARRALEWKP